MVLIDKTDMESALKSLRIADVEIFIGAALMKNLGKSAQLHHLSQSAASAAVQRVESAFGIPLCTHEKRQFRLTPAGQHLLPRIESWIKQLKELVVSQTQVPLRLVTTHALAQIAVPALLSIEKIDFKHLRPDRAYAAILRNEADIALVLDNAPWKGVISTEIGRGFFQLYSREKNAPLQPILLPEDQMEVLSLQQTWLKKYNSDIPVKSRIPSWSLIANICASSAEVGFLPDFLAAKFHLHPVEWQPAVSQYRVLAIYRSAGSSQERFERLLQELCSVFTAS
jgi:DNA-binding transcriptional LysR family regulator